MFVCDLVIYCVAVMKVEEVAPSGLPSTTKLTLIISKDDSASSSSDGADSGCLAESPEYGKEDSLCHSDVCTTPDMARSDTKPTLQPPHTALDDRMLSQTNSGHIHSKSSSTTSEDSSSNMGAEDWVTSFPAQVVTSYLEINCNKNVMNNDVNISTHETNNRYFCSNDDPNDNNNICNITCEDTAVKNSTICATLNNTAHVTFKNIKSALINGNSAEELSDTNSNDSSKLLVKHSESQSNSGTEESVSLTNTNASSISDDPKTSCTVAVSVSANCSHEITLSLSQLSDFEVTKQKIKEMRKSFLTNLALEEFFESSNVAESVSRNESSFLVQLQNKRANRLKLKQESQEMVPAETKSHLREAPPRPRFITELYEPSCRSEFQMNGYHGLRVKNGCNFGPPCSSTVIHRITTGEIDNHRIPARIGANLDIVNANRPHVAFNNQCSSLPPSVACSPSHCISGQVEPTPAGCTASTPCSPHHLKAHNSNHLQYSRFNNEQVELISRRTPQDKLGQYFGESLSRSADLKPCNSESDEITRQYFRTRSLEEGSKMNDKIKSRSPVSSIRRVFSQRISSKVGVSPCDKTTNKNTSTHFAVDPNSNIDHTYENSTFVDRIPNKNSFQLKNGLNSENSNVWLLEKTAQLLKLKKYRNKNKGLLSNDNKSDSDTDHREQKVKLRDACKDVARALFSLPNSPERTRETRSQSPPPSFLLCPRPAPPLPPPTAGDLERDLSLSRQVRRRQHLLSAAESSPRNSYHDTHSCCCPPGSVCQCLEPRFNGYQYPHEGLQRSPAFFDGWQKLSLQKRPNSAPNICDSDLKRVNHGKSHKRRIKAKESEITSSDDDYADDYCQTDECGDDCDYCSGDDAGDEEDDVCDRCQTSSGGSSSVCKHPHFLKKHSNVSIPCSNTTNGRVPQKLVGGGTPIPGHSVTPVSLSCEQQHQVPSRSMLTVGMAPAASSDGTAPQQQQSHPRRRRSAASCSEAPAPPRHHAGLGAIRESSATSDDQLDTEEEQFSYDGSNCDLSRSWRFGLSRDSGQSRDSTLCSDSSCTSVPNDHLRLLCKEKSNSLPGAYTRSPPVDAQRQRPGSTLIRVGSTSEEDSVISSGVVSNPTRPPRAPRTRCPTSPNPPIPPISPSPGSPRPTMGIQGLQRSPNMSRAAHVSGLPTSPRMLYAPRTVAPRSPNNPNPPYGFSQVVPDCQPPGSPRTSCRAGGLVMRNFSISDDENGRRCPRRQVTISRHETAYKEAAEKGYVLPPGSPVDPYWLTWVSTKCYLIYQDTRALLWVAISYIETILTNKLILWVLIYKQFRSCLFMFDW